MSLELFDQPLIEILFFKAIYVTPKKSQIDVN